MKLYPSATLIITTYNWPKALKLVLLSLKNQSTLPTEIIVADDGSGEKTRHLIAKFKEILPIPLIHIWHKDDGFKRTTILNKAICKASSKYIIQIDGDIILHKHFIKNHLQLAKKNTFIQGSRVLLNESLTKISQEKNRIDFKWFSKGIKNRFNAMYLPFLTPLFTSPSTKISDAIDARGCNISFWKEDLVLINGYDEDMIGWGREDSEISVRLVNTGKTKVKIKFRAIQYHQYHPINSRNGLNKNDEILAESIKEKRAWCKKGLSKHC